MYVIALLIINWVSSLWNILRARKTRHDLHC